MKLSRTLLPLFLLFFVQFSSVAQIVCPPNIDFELGTLAPWSFFNGTVATGPVYTLLPSPPVPGREDLMSGSGLDPYGSFPVVGAGAFSCRLGKDTSNYCAERARYQIHVPAGATNYSLIYRYAIVLQDASGDHAPSEVPRFEVSAYDSATGGPIPCAQFEYVASSSLPGFKVSPVGFNVVYKDWATGSMNLSGYAGKTITIDFTAADCTLGGHFGYGYLDMSCGLFAIGNVACDDDSVRLTAPFGYSTYSWYDSLTFSTLYGIADTINIPMPSVTTTYAVIMDPYSGFGCTDTLYTTIVPSQLKTHPSRDTTICLGESVTLKSGGTDITSPLTYLWSGGGTIACSTCDSTLVTPGVGKTAYIVKVTNPGGCSLKDTIHVTTLGVYPGISSTNVSCYGRSDGTATATPFSWTPPFTYKWSTIPPQTTAMATGLPVGTYTVQFTDNSGCTNKSVVTITQPPPTVIALADSSDPTRCNLLDGSITISGLVPGGSFTIKYRFNGVSKTAAVIASGSGRAVLVSLGQGYYDSITVVGTLCPYNVIGPVVLTDPPKPPPPPVVPQYYCQYDAGKALVAHGANLMWYGPGIVGVIIAPVPVTIVPGTEKYYVTQTVAGCVSDSSMLPVVVYPKPKPPLTVDTTYCQFAPSGTLTAEGVGLKWYRHITDTTPLSLAPVPSTDTVGNKTWYVNQTINGCPSDKAPIKVTILYKPLFSISQEQPFVCQFDSIWLAYNGPALTDPAFIWSIPDGESYTFNKYTGAGISTPKDTMIYVRFDSVTENNYIRLFASNYNGRCFSDTFLRIKIIPHPTATSYQKRDVCVGDTISLALSSKSDNAARFTWLIDNESMGTTNALTIVAHSSVSGGPLSVSWNDSGRHVIQMLTETVEGCRSPFVEDTINVHTLPDANFKFVTKSGPLCLEDSVLFSANFADYTYAYQWTPAHYFRNINKPDIYGKMEQSQSLVTLRVTDPFGCVATTSQQLDPSSCCTVGFPNAFTPNGDNKNDYFRPIYVGYHRFHTFRVANRWGQTVFESTNSDMKWDGNFNGIPQDIGVYFYYLKYDCGGSTREAKGDVTLIR